MKRIAVVWGAVVLMAFGGCSSSSSLAMKPYISEFGGDPEKTMRSIEAMGKRGNWKRFEAPIEGIVFCAVGRENFLTQRGWCVPGAEYVVKKFLPRAFSRYRYIVFEDGNGKESIFLLENLPRKTDQDRLLIELERIDP